MTITQIKEWLTLSAIVIGGYWAYKASQTVTNAAEKAGDYLGELYADLTSPDLVEPQIRLQARYFDESGQLLPEVRRVIIEGYPNLYKALFVNDVIRDEYAHFIDSGQPLTDSMFYMHKRQG